ncbi:MAG TPA: adenosylmethionine decarboxylase, partial [Shewanella sp.]|nr:adenosylmethionine decarboxylase [Shewanella sp.]
MFFEGSEKKIEVIVTPATPSLRSLGKPFWEE